jgi:hypothetical protein
MDFDLLYHPFFMMACVMTFLFALNERVDDLSRQIKCIVDLLGENLKKQFNEKFSREEGNKKDDEI